MSKDERKSLEESIRQVQSENKCYQKILESLDLPILLTDKEGKILFTNQAFDAKLGVPDAEQSSFSYLSEKDQQIAQDQYQALLTEGTSLSHEFNVATADGNEHRLLVKGERIISDDLQEPNVLTTFEDITAYRHTEAQLEQERHELETILDNINDAIFIHGNDLQFQFVNTTACEQLGYTRDELLQLSPQKLDTPKYAELVEQRLKNLFEEGKARFETQHRRKDGSILDVEINQRFIEFLGNNYIISVARDVTEQKKLQQSIRDYNELLQSLIEQSPTPVFYKNTELEYVMFNTLFAHDVLNLSPSAIEGKHLNDLNINISKTDISQTLAMDSKVLKTKEKVIYSQKMHHDDGTVREYQVSKAPFIDGEGNITGIIGVMYDISELKTIQDQLTQARDEAERANALKSAFLANMSHEIRTPLNGIIGFSELIYEDPATPEHLRDATMIIEKSSQNLLQIITDVLEISKIESGEYIYTPELYSPYTVFTQAQEDAEKLCSRYGKEIKLFQTYPAEHTQIDGDSRFLKQCIMSLIDNAIKFTEEGSIEHGMKITENTLEYYIQDTGIGIPIDQEKDILQPFVQGDLSPTRKYGGNGLGLSITHKLVSLMNGTMQIKPRDDREGTYVSFSIPFLQREDPMVQARSDPETNTDKQFYTVAIVDDEVINRLVIQNILKDNDINPVMFSDGVGIVEYYTNNNSLDLIIMDLNMPNMNGHEAAQQIRSYEKMTSIENVPIIAYTADGRPETQELCYQEGFNDFIEKPISLKKMEQKIRIYLQ